MLLLVDVKVAMKHKGDVNSDLIAFLIYDY